METRSMKRRRLEEDLKADKSPSPLESLPRELVWMIIEKAPETVLSLRQTSRSLHSHVTTYALEPSTIPLVESISVNFCGYSFPEVYDDRPYLRITLPMANNRLFTLRAKLRFPKLRFERDDLSGGDIWAQIGNIYFDFINELAPLIKWAKMLEGINAQSLAFFIDKSMSAKATLVIGLNVNRLSLRVRGEIHPDPVQLLTKLSSLVSAIDIDQDMELGGHLNSHYLFGESNVGWAEKIAEMFSKKLDHLTVLTEYYHECLDGRTVRRIREKLARLGKKVTLKAREKWTDNVCYIKLE